MRGNVVIDDGACGNLASFSDDAARCDGGVRPQKDAFVGFGLAVKAGIRGKGAVSAERGFVSDRGIEVEKRVGLYDGFSSNKGEGRGDDALADFCRCRDIGKGVEKAGPARALGIEFPDDLLPLFGCAQCDKVKGSFLHGHVRAADDRMVPV